MEVHLENSNEKMSNGAKQTRITVSQNNLAGERLDVAPPKAAYAGGLEAVNEWVGKALSQMFEAKQVSGVLTIPEVTASQLPEVEA